MSRQIYAYSLIRTFYDSNKDFIDSFWGLVVTAFPLDGKPISIEELQSEVNTKYDLLIPIHSLTTIITRASRQNYVKKEEKTISLLDKGKEFIKSRIESQKDATRRVNEMLDNANNYIRKQYELNIEITDLKATIQEFVLENLETFETFFVADFGKSPVKKESQPPINKYLLDYFFHVEKSEPRIFKTIQDIICGSVISAVVKKPEFLNESEKKFETVVVFLDSNFLLSLLGMRYDQDNKPAKELFNLMKESGSFKFSVFDFTIDEIMSLLNNFETENKIYPKHIKFSGVSSLHASLKAQGWTSAKLTEFIVHIENKLWNDLGITIQPTDVNLKKYHISDLERIKNLAKYKPRQTANVQNHDLAAIDHIKSLRKGFVRRIELSKYIFLTSDVKLARYNFFEEEHKNKNTVGEVVLDNVLTNILWLKKPNIESTLTLDSLIAALSKNLFVDTEVWRSFYKNVAELKREGKINSEQASILIYHRHTHDVLSDISSQSANELPDPIQILEDIHDSIPPNIDLEENIIQANDNKLNVRPESLPDIKDHLTSVLLEKLEVFCKELKHLRMIKLKQKEEHLFDGKKIRRMKLNQKQKNGYYYLS